MVPKVNQLDSDQFPKRNETEFLRMNLCMQCCTSGKFLTEILLFFHEKRTDVIPFLEFRYTCNIDQVYKSNEAYAISDFNWFFRMQAGGGSDSMNCVGVIWMPLLLCHVLDLDEN